MITSPSRKMSPSSISSSRSTQRSIVDLPEPEAPITRDRLVLVDAEVDAAQDLELAERLRHALELEHRAVALIAPPSDAAQRSSSRASGIVIAR